MNKELQDLAWSVLPKEFREEVKKLYREFAFTREGYYKELFGRRNLISDAEEEEMLTVPRKKIQDFFMNFKREKSDAKSVFDKISLGARISMLQELFGSKCLPDNVDSSKPNVDSLEPKQAEPKFKVGDEVKDISSPHDGGIYKVDDIKKSSDGFIYHIQGLIGKSNVKESDLEPYTEPTDFGRDANFPTKNNLAIYLKKSKNCDNRLQIAAMAMQGILSNENAIQYAINNFRLQDGSRNRYQAVAECSLAFADALIAEGEKGAER